MFKVLHVFTDDIAVGSREASRESSRERSKRQKSRSSWTVKGFEVPLLICVLLCVIWDSCTSVLFVGS